MRGDLSSHEVLAREAKAADGVVSLAEAPSGDVAAAATATFLDALRGSNKPFVFTSGSWVYGDTKGRVVDEDGPFDPPQLAAWLPGVERNVLSAAHTGVRATIIRPTLVYGDHGGLTAMWEQSARETGFARVVGSGESRWTTVHRNDLADLYRLVLENAAASTVWNAAHGPAVRVLDMATSLSKVAGSGKVRLWSVDDARATLGPLADALVLDQLISGERAKAQLGWAPNAPSALVELQRARELTALEGLPLAIELAAVERWEDIGRGNDDDETFGPRQC